MSPDREPSSATKNISAALRDLDEALELSPERQEERRLLSLIASADPDDVPELMNQLGSDAVAHVLHALARETVATSITVEQTRELTRATGVMVTGLLGLGYTGSDEWFAKLHGMGATMRSQLALTDP